jgi:hypothetical protein
MSRDIVELDDVLAEEREEIALRRKQAGFSPSEVDAPRDYLPDDITDPIGLAISGGGVRSAAFSLGVLQALYERGLLRYCDYLSTVSGGSYVGGFLTSLAVHRHSELSWKKRSSPTASSNQPPNVDAAPRLPPARENAAANNGSRSEFGGTPAGSILETATRLSTGTASNGRPTTRSAQTIRRSTDALAERITIQPDEQRRQPHYVRRLVLGSSYLDRPLLFFSHWLPGFLQNNIIALGFLLFACGLGAWLFRLLDTQHNMLLLHTLGFSDDISRAFFPTVVIFTIWVLLLVYRAGRAFLGNRSGAATVAPSLTLLLIISAMVSLVSLMGVGDINTQLFVNRLNIPINPAVLAQIQSVASWLMYTVLAVAILPYLSAGALVKSGAANASWRDKMFFKFMTHAMLWGVPLVLFGLLASENISRINSRRDDQYLLSSQTIKEWPAFAAQLSRGTLKSNAGSSEAGGQGKLDDVNAALWESLKTSRYPVVPQQLVRLAATDSGQLLADSSALRSVVRPQPDVPGPPGDDSLSAADLVLNVARESDHRTQVARHKSWSYRLASATAWLFGIRENNDFAQLYASETKFQCDRDLAVALLNDQLLRLDFSTAFEPLATWLAPPPDGKLREAPVGLGTDAGRLMRAYRHARHVEAELQASPLLAQAVERFRDLRLLDAVIAHQLELHPDRSQWSADLYPLRQQLRQELDELQHPLERIAQYNELEEALLETKLRELEKTHFELMYSFYGPQQMHSADDVFARVVVDADQAYRRWLFLVALAVFLLAGLCIDLNSTSLHRFYRDRLASVWLVGEPDEVPLLTDLKTSDKGAPYLLVNGALTFLNPAAADRESTAGFLFSHRACGSSRLGFAPSSRYEGGKFDLADAMAISGAAITPTATRNLAVQALMWLMNWRLGRWMANPGVRALLDRPASYRRIWQRPQALHLLLSALLVPEQERDFHFVSDGGLHENLGIEPLVERRCRLILAVDAGADPKEHFDDLVKLLLRLRLHHGVEIEALNGVGPEIMEAASLARLLPRNARGEPAADGQCRSHFIVARIRYPDQPANQPAWLVYIRPGFSGDESEALRRFRTQNSSFPNDATDDQFYTFSRFEAYRLLGEHTGDTVCREIAPGLPKFESMADLLSAVEHYACPAAENSTARVPTQSVQGDAPTASGASAPSNGKPAEHAEAKPPQEDELPEDLERQLDETLREIITAKNQVPRGALARLEELHVQLERSDPDRADEYVDRIQRAIFAGLRKIKSRRKKKETKR